MIDPYPINATKLDLLPCEHPDQPPGMYDVPCEWVVEPGNWLSNPFHHGEALWQLLPVDIYMMIGGVTFAYIGPGYEANPYTYGGVVVTEDTVFNVTYPGTPDGQLEFPSHGFVYTVSPVFMPGAYGLHCVLNEATRPNPYLTYNYEVIATNPIRWQWYDVPQYYNRVGGGRCRIPYGTPGEPWGDSPDYAIIIYGFNIGYPWIGTSTPLLSGYVFPVLPVLPLLFGCCLFGAAGGGRKGRK